MLFIVSPNKYSYIIEENVYKTKALQDTCKAFAEAGGFEPPVRLPVRQFSKLVVSATHPNFLYQY